MVILARLRKLGNALGVTIPKALVDHLKLKRGELLALRASGGKIIISRIDDRELELSGTLRTLPSALKLRPKPEED